MTKHKTTSKSHEKPQKEAGHPKGHKGKKHKKEFAIKKLLLPAGILIVLILLLVFVPKIFNSSKTVAIVNGEKITENDLNSLYNIIPAQYRQMVTQEQLLNQTINEKLVLQKAAESGVKKTDADAETYVLQQLLKSGLNINQFKQSLEMQGLDYDDILDLYKRQLVINEFLNSTLSLDVEVSDQDVSDYYYAHKDEFKQDEQVKASHILVSTRDEAEDVLSKIKSGEEFEELAKEYSTDSSAMLGGDLGYFGKGVMVKEFEDAAFKLSIGEVSPIVQTQFGYHIIKLTGRQDAKTLPLSEVRDQIKSFLIQEKQKMLVQEYLGNLRAVAEITIIE